MRLRPATLEDCAALAALFGAVDEACQGRPSRLDADVVADWLPSDCLETNTWLMERDGFLLGGAFAELHGDRGVSAGAVHPTARGQGLGTQLVELAEQRLAEEGAARHHAWTAAGDEAADELFSARGYRPIRRFWDMTIELGPGIPEPEVTVELFRPEEAREYHAALEEAFADHWEHQAESFDQWWSRQQKRASYDPSLWFVIKDGEEIAGAIRNDPDQLGGGYVGALGVRRPWRGRGFGRALLLHSFREFWRRGMPRASLGVDAANPTGATRLYESVGMEIELENVVWEKLVG